MRPQQRKFIVEVKSARRRSTIRPTSIWGDTDLKELVRKAEAEAPHLFDPAEGPNELSPTQSVEIRANESTSTSDTTQIADLVALTEVSAGVEEAAISPLETDSPKIAPPTPPKRRRSKRNIIRDGRAATIAATEAGAFANDLVALEEENRRLKGLLAHRLQQENIQLRKMLERFEVK
ncbi:hypothetical protein [Ensifer sesbaniae]|jgi:hypothetical protein|uniref:hypothetical protein n=1 Tax=Ensifer sesbaniae TaxID=1214071 RepID=UPI00156A5206|nr:hypothetical protein [Ensifer sesbaniae]NRQ17513.1 hypothetical protein [Ensifer sesbaniae]